MRTSLVARFLKKCAGGVLRTTKEKWIDGAATVLTILFQVFLGKPSTFWEALTPFIWLLSAICAVHVVRATCEIWREIRNQPKLREVESPILLDSAGRRTTLISEPIPRYFRARLIGMLLVSLLLLGLLSYWARSVAVASVRTYIYLVPAAELMECQKRAFFIKTVGPQTLYNVQTTLKDNKSGQTYSQTYPEIDPGPRSADVFFWFVPSSPWDEDYTVTVATRESHSSQRLIARSTQHQFQFAMQITIDDERNPALSCRDTLLPESYTLAAGERRPCSEIMKLTGDVPSKLNVDSYQSANGNFTIRRMKELPLPSELDEQSDDRHITEYQRQIIEPILQKYSRSHMLVYFAGGRKSKAYAEEFCKMFGAKKWTVTPPTLVPIGDERIIDIQMSVNYQENWSKYNPKPHDVLNAFERAGIKQRSKLTLDPNVPSDWIVLWVGPRSPNGVRPDQCLPAEMKPVEGQHHACEMISQIDGGSCPVPPQ
jgi:hypothetical protein